MYAKAEHFAQFCTACLSDFFIVMALITNIVILGIMATMMWAMLP